MSTFYASYPVQGGGSGVTSLNGLTGALTLVAGSGITITPSGSSLTIASTGGGGSVTNVSVVTANGLSGTVANPSTTPAITLAPTFTGIAYSTGTALQTAVAANFPVLNQNTTGTAANVTATSNSSLVTLSSLSLPYSQVTGGPSVNAITALTGDVTATGPGSAAATVAAIQGKTISGTTGTTNVVFSASPTLTGILTAAAANFSATVEVAPSSDTKILGLQQFSATPTSTSDYLTLYNSSSAVVANIDYLGRFNAASGTSATPGYGFRTQAGMGMFYQGSNILGFAANGTGSLYLNNGSLGIGTAAPNGSLDVYNGNARISQGHNLVFADTSANLITVIPPSGSAYNFNLPTTAGTSGQVLTSGGGGASVMTWTTVAAATAISRSISSVSTPTTLGSTAYTDYVYFVSGTTTVTLPSAVGNTNLYTVKNTGSNTVTIATTSSQTIDGSVSASLSVANTSLDLISDGSNWRIV